MDLEKLTGIVDGHVERGGHFESLGTLVCNTPRMLSYAEDPQYLAQAHTHKNLSCLICTPEVRRDLERDLGVFVTEVPRAAFFTFHNWLVVNTEFYRKRLPTYIDASAQIHPAAIVAEHNVRIGRNVVVEPSSVIHANTTLDDDVVIRANVTLGGQGFEYKRLANGILRVEHGGGVHLHRGAEVLSNSFVARGLFGGDTEIGAETRIDAQVNISHNVRIGARCLIAAGCAISGSAVLGDDVWVGPGVTISDSVKVGNRSQLSIGAVVVADVAEGTRVSGNFAIPHGKFLAAYLRSQR